MPGVGNGNLLAANNMGNVGYPQGQPNAAGQMWSGIFSAGTIPNWGGSGAMPMVGVLGLGFGGVIDPNPPRRVDRTRSASAGGLNAINTQVMC